MKVAIMQPYLFPYLGYLQLIGAVDRFVIYDDVNFINRGWINRNHILGKDGPQRFTLQLIGASQNKLINEIEIGDNGPEILATFAQTYARAPFCSSVLPIVETCLLNPEKNLARFLEFSLRTLCSSLGVKTEILVSSEIEKDSRLKATNKILAICKILGADTYINPIGGMELYDREMFLRENLRLYFLKMGHVVYKQRGTDFIPNLSIIDIMMFNSPEQIAMQLKQYELI